MYIVPAQRCARSELLTKYSITMYLHRGVMGVPARSALLTKYNHVPLYLHRGVMGVPASIVGHNFR